MDISIDSIFEKLSWDSSDELQQEGICEASNIRHLSVLICPIESKSVWENCAKVLASKTDAELERYLPELFEWIQDMNWPGADIIYDRLKCIPADLISCAYTFSLEKAIRLNDNPWICILKTFDLSI